MRLPNSKAFLLRQGTDLRYGARHLKRTITRQVVSPLANLLASGQVELGDMVSNWDNDARRLVFENQGPAPPTPMTQQPSQHSRPRWLDVHMKLSPEPRFLKSVFAQLELVLQLPNASFVIAH